MALNLDVLGWGKDVEHYVSRKDITIQNGKAAEIESIPQELVKKSDLWENTSGGIHPVLFGLGELVAPSAVGSSHPLGHNDILFSYALEAMSRRRVQEQRACS